MRASGYERTANDWYCEPSWVVDALLSVEPFDGQSWDPSCGGGNIPRTMIARGLDCRGSDVVNRGYGAVLDFFKSEDGADNIVTNPPYGVIEPYIRLALMRATRKVAILARLALLEGIKRRALFQSTPLARVWVSSRRVSMPPGGSGIQPKGGAIAYAWFVWVHGHTDGPRIGWLP